MSELGPLMSVLGENLVRRATVESVYGQPILVGELTFIPVARIQYGFGAGDSEGSLGGGGGLEATPLGMIELSAQGARFLPLSASDSLAEVAEGILELGPNGWLLGHQGRFALINTPAPGAWLQHVTGAVDFVLGEETELFPQARRIVTEEAVWAGELGGEPLFVLNAPLQRWSDRLVVFRGVLLVPRSQVAEVPAKVVAAARAGVARALDGPYWVHSMVLGTGPVQPLDLRVI